MSSDPRTRLADAQAEFDRRVRDVGASAWARPSPCPDWSVRDVVNHVVYENRWAPHLLRGEDLDAVGDAYDGDLLGDDPVGSWAAAATGCREAAAAAPLDGTIHASFGDISVEFYLRQLAAEHIVHAWDVARGAGIDEALDPAFVDEIADWFAEYETFYREIGVTGQRPPLPDGADAQARLLAAFGRAA